MIQNRIITITDTSRTPDGEETSKVITKGCMVGGPEDYTLHFSEMLDDEYTCDTRMHVKKRCCVNDKKPGEQPRVFCSFLRNNHPLFSVKMFSLSQS